MIKLPLEVLKEYQARLRALDVSSHESPHYVKWVRYFLDFEEKYGRNFEETKVVEGFIAKLASKGQSAGLRAQARRAVEIYQGLDRMVDEAPVAFKLDPDERARVKSKPQSVAAVEKKSNTVKRAPGKTGRGSPLKGKADAGSKDSRSFDNWAELQRAMTGEIKRRNYSPKTLSGYMKWVRQFGEFTDHMPVEEISDESARDFLTHLAVNGHVVASTQNQAFNALLFLFRHILKRDYELGDSVTRAKVSKYIPTVLTRSEVDAVLANLKFPHNLIVSMLYGCGLRLSECLELRMGDLDFMQARHGACFPAQLCQPFAGG
jgi:hypothetical protein